MSIDVNPKCCSRELSMMAPKAFADGPPVCNELVPICNTVLLEASFYIDHKICAIVEAILYHFLDGNPTYN